MEGQGEDPAQLTYAQLMQRASEGGNWQRALELFDGASLSWGWPGLAPLRAVLQLPHHLAWTPLSLASLVPSHAPSPPILPAPPLPAAGMEGFLTLSGSQPNALTYSAAIIACARLADWQRAVELKDQMLAR